MRPLFLQFLLSIALLTAFDALWFTAIMNKFFIHRLSHLLNIHAGHVVLRWIPAILVYIFLACGIVFFVLPSGGVIGQYPVFIRGAIFGAIVYGVYEGTNGALMMDWPLSLIIVDILWAAWTCGTTAFVVKAFIR